MNNSHQLSMAVLKATVADVDVKNRQFINEAFWQQMRLFYQAPSRASQSPNTHKVFKDYLLSPEAYRIP